MIIKLGKLEVNTRSLADTFAKVKNTVIPSTKEGMPDFQPRKIWNMWEHKNFGDRMAWLDFDGGEIEGHIGSFGDKVKKDDEIRCKMQSGKISRWKVIKVEYQKDPTDQFFAWCVFLGYVEGVTFDVNKAQEDEDKYANIWEKNKELVRQQQMSGTAFIPPTVRNTKL